MKCKNCNGDLKYDNGVLVCQSCGSTFSVNAGFEDVDVYLCYRENDSSGRRTKDSLVAQEIYYLLEKEKIKTYYSRISLEQYIGDVAVSADELAILNAKIVLMIGISKENYETLWNSNKERISGKKIIPVYAGMNAYDIPKEINALQALKYDNVGASADLINGILKLLGKRTEKDQSYEEVSKKQRKKRQLLLVICIAIVVILISLVAVLLFMKKQESDSDNKEETNKIENNKTKEENKVEEDLSERYSHANELIEVEKYSDAIEILTGLSDYKDSKSLLRTCYAKYSGYYYDESSAMLLQIQSYDDTSMIKISSNTKAVCTIEETVSFKGNKCSFPYIDSEGNHGNCDIVLVNTGIDVKIENTKLNSEINIPDISVNLLIKDRADQPIKKTVDINLLKQILASPTSIEDLKRQGYELSFDSIVGIEVGDDRIYSFNNTEIELITYVLPEEGEEYVTGDTDEDRLIVYVIEAPMSIVDPDRIGDIDKPYMDGDYLYCPNGNYSAYVGEINYANLEGEWLDLAGYSGSKVIDENTKVIIKIANDYEKLIMQEKEKSKSEDERINGEVDNSETWHDMTDRFENVEPFFGVWCAFSDNKEDVICVAENICDIGLEGYMFNSESWMNLRGNNLYVVSAGIYNNEYEANMAMARIKDYYPGAFIRKSGGFIVNAQYYEVTDIDLGDDYPVYTDVFRIESLIAYAQTKELTEEDLMNYGSFELSAVRNGIYAKYGYVFKTPEWNEYFSGFDWYTPNPAFTSERLSSLENKNTTKIREFEERVYGGLFSFGR